MNRYIRFKKCFEYIPFDEIDPVYCGNAYLPGVAFVPLLQHDGLPAEPIVSEGNRITEGQMIARGKMADSTHVHAPIPGILQEFREIPLPDGSVGTAAVILLSGSFNIIGKKESQYPWQTMAPSEILHIISDKGVINTFGAPIPLYPQLKEALHTSTNCLVMRFFDDDPTCQLDTYLVRHGFKKLIEGLAILARSISATMVYLIFKRKERSYIPDMSEIEGLFPNCVISVLNSNDRYPAGNCKQLADLISETKSSKELAHAVFVEPVTVISVYDAVVKNQPVIYRYVFIGGPAVYKSAVLKVKIGTPIGDLIEECGGFRTTPSRIVINGLLTGTAIYDLDTPVTKMTKSIHLLDKESCPEYVVRNCIHCGRCRQVCPAGIDPMRAVYNIRHGNLSVEQKKMLKACQYCGCCAIVCPARIPLHQIIKETNRNNGA